MVGVVCHGNGFYTLNTYFKNRYLLTVASLKDLTWIRTSRLLAVTTYMRQPKH
jgi:hypothetical protein